MKNLTRRSFVAAGMFSTVAVASGAYAQTVPKPQRQDGVGGDDPGPRNTTIDRDNPTLMNPPSTDSGTLPNLRFPFGDAHVRQESGGWTRQVTERELPVSTTIAGVDMRLNEGGIRELHWHKEAEWAYMTYGKARITAVDTDGNYFVDDVEVGDLWYFPPGIPHSIQGLGPDGCEFLLAFDDGGFDENSTFLLSDWFKHIPKEVLAKNFGIDPSHVGNTPDPSEEYIFAGKVPGSLDSVKPKGADEVSEPFSHRMLQQEPIKTPGGTVRITDSSVFKVSKTIAAALVELEPGGLRELHWHTNNDEWQYYLSGTGRLGVFAGAGEARTYDVHEGDVGYIPFAMGHYIENTGDTTMRFLELFKSDHYADISLNQWLALTPPELVKAHLGLDDTFMDSLKQQKSPVVSKDGARKS
ncbi:oxalate decarboxylase [Kushneria pakistanensis]|uniref:Oxalate decarboxylase n=1 Tax=Kushneria pakistanensis TaxID=1508770 RepID=A0ABQ3FJI5_9GAMM|nr:oxalate decarboxylase family bicupin [Kushneria pakistanensis]GHC26139.1 oxalate decarboxylase [Kushneria pakistanensis]